MERVVAHRAVVAISVDVIPEEVDGEVSLDGEGVAAEFAEVGGLVGVGVDEVALEGEEVVEDGAADSATVTGWRREETREGAQGFLEPGRPDESAQRPPQEPRELHVQERRASSGSLSAPAATRAGRVRHQSHRGTPRSQTLLNYLLFFFTLLWPRPIVQGSLIVVSSSYHVDSTVFLHLRDFPIF